MLRVGLYLKIDFKTSGVKTSFLRVREPHPSVDAGCMKKHLLIMYKTQEFICDLNTSPEVTRRAIQSFPNTCPNKPLLL